MLIHFRCASIVIAIVIGVSVGVRFFSSVCSVSFRFVLFCAVFAYIVVRAVVSLMEQSKTSYKHWKCVPDICLLLSLSLSPSPTLSDFSYLYAKRLQQHSTIIHLVLYGLPIQSKTIVKSNFFSFSWKSLLAAASLRKMRTYRIYMFIWTYIDGCKWLNVSMCALVSMLMCSEKAKGAGVAKPPHRSRHTSAHVHVHVIVDGCSYFSCRDKLQLNSIFFSVICILLILLIVCMPYLSLSIRLAIAAVNIDTSFIYIRRKIAWLTVIR